MPATPLPKYLTVVGRDIMLSENLHHSYERLAFLLRTNFLRPTFVGARFNAWNANRFDVRLMFNSVVDFLPDYGIEPFIAKTGAIRGARIFLNEKPSWFWLFLDGMTMTGLTKTPLKKFVEIFAPHVPKLSGAVNFEIEEFDSTNGSHVAYAERDSVSLFAGLGECENQTQSFTGFPLSPTVGRLAIKYFATQIPPKISIWRLKGEWNDIVKNYGYRGGYVFTAKKYHGPLYQYDLNQAYAAAMRDARLPCGTAWEVSRYDNERVGVYVCILWRDGLSRIPVFLRRCDGWNTTGQGMGEVGESAWAVAGRTRTVLLSNEIDTLTEYGWHIEIEKGLVWNDSFNMAAMVDALEEKRSDNPSGPLGTICKMLGCNAYGKTVEQIPDLRYCITAGNPRTDKENWLPTFPESDSLGNFWTLHRSEAQGERVYHVPQIGAFITADVRMRVYRAANLRADCFIKADTDSVAFSEPVDLPLHKWEYGKWKKEYDGTEAIVIGKKVYATRDTEFHPTAKGLSTRYLTWEDFEEWFENDNPPRQIQTQLQSWKKGIGVEAPMFSLLEKRGSNVKIQTG